MKLNGPVFACDSAALKYSQSKPIEYQMPMNAHHVNCRLSCLHCKQGRTSVFKTRWPLVREVPHRLRALRAEAVSCTLSFSVCKFVPFFCSRRRIFGSIGSNAAPATPPACPFASAAPAPRPAPQDVHLVLWQAITQAI